MSSSGWGLLDPEPPLGCTVGRGSSVLNPDGALQAGEARAPSGPGGRQPLPSGLVTTPARPPASTRARTFLLPPAFPLWPYV